MSKKRKVVKTIGGISLISGIFVLIGTAGSSDLGRISASDVITQLGIGVVLLAVGCFVINLATGGGVFND